MIHETVHTQAQAQAAAASAASGGDRPRYAKALVAVCGLVAVYEIDNAVSPLRQTGGL